MHDDAIAIVLQNVIQYFSLRPLIQKINKDNLWKLDILVYDPGVGDRGFSEIRNELVQVLANDGLKYYNAREPREKYYKIIFAPYADMTVAKSKYLLGYYYGSACAKPNPTFLPEFKRKFHGFLIHSTYDAEILSVYGETYIVPNLRLSRVKIEKKKDEKIKVLYLPTYGDVGDSERLVPLMRQLKDEYYFIVKGHHGINHLTADEKKKDLLIDLADEFYDSTADMQKLFSRVDLVVSDNSGAIFDALYVGVPICIVAEDINKKLDEMETLQSMLVKDKIIPFTKGRTTEAIRKVLVETLEPDNRKRQQRYAEKLYPNRDGGAQDWVKIISDYMSDKVSQDYIKLHDFCIKQDEERQTLILELRAENDNLRESLSKLEFEKRTLEQQLRAYTESRTHKAVDRVIKIAKNIKK